MIDYFLDSWLIFPDLTQEILLDGPDCELSISSCVKKTQVSLQSRSAPSYIRPIVYGLLYLSGWFRRLIDNIEERHLGRTSYRREPTVSVSHVLQYTSHEGWGSAVWFQRKIDQLLQDLPASFNMYFMLSLCYSSSWKGLGVGVGIDRDQERGLHETRRILVMVRPWQRNPSSMSAWGRKVRKKAYLVHIRNSAIHDFTFERFEYNGSVWSFEPSLSGRR